jgi:hypothetical protein
MRAIDKLIEWWDAESKKICPPDVGEIHDMARRLAEEKSGDEGVLNEDSVRGAIANILDMTADTVAKIMLDKYRQCHEATEPKDCGFTLATCPYERCSGITMRDPKAEEPLAVKEPHIICLAAAKHYRIRPAMTAKAWIISLVKIGDRNDKFVAKGETYWEAERQARAFLMGLPDKGDTK